MKCQKCGTEHTANFCPNCGAPANEPVASSGQNTTNPNGWNANASATPSAPAPKKKKKGCLIAVLIVVVLIIIGIIIGVAGGDDDSSGSGKSNTASTSDTTPEKTEYGINDPATYKDAEISVTNVEKSSGSEFDTPKEGMEYVIVTVQIRNVGDSNNISYNPFDFKMLNSQGQLVDQTFTTVNTDTSLSSGELTPGGQVSGTIAFEQPVGDTGLVLQYTGNIWLSDSTLSFNLQ